MTDPSTESSAAGWNILGHAWAVEMLRRQIERGTLHHAYLFAGPPGVGRRTLALRFAQALNCTEPIEPGIPCGSCWECKQINRAEHPDLRIFEGKTSRKDDAPGDRGEDDDSVSEYDEPQVDPLGNLRSGLRLKVGQVRQITPYLNLKPYRAKYRLALLLRFQEATDSAANALLKTLEETPPSSIMVLTADNIENLPPTIVSRCELLRLQPLPMEAVESFLTAHGAEDEQARLLAHVSGGRPGYALRLLQQPGALEYRQEKLRELQTLLAATRAQRFAYAEKLGKDRIIMHAVLTLWLSFWRDVLWRASGASAPLANIDSEHEIEQLAKRLGMPEVRRIVSDLDSAVTRLEGSVNARLLAEVTLLDWPK